MMYTTGSDRCPLAPAGFERGYLSRRALMRLPVCSEWPRQLMQRTCQSMRRVYFGD